MRHLPSADGGHEAVAAFLSPCSTNWCQVGCEVKVSSWRSAPVAGSGVMRSGDWTEQFEHATNRLTEHTVFEHPPRSRLKHYINSTPVSRLPRPVNRSMSCSSNVCTIYTAPIKRLCGICSRSFHTSTPACTLLYTGRSSLQCRAEAVAPTNHAADDAHDVIQASRPSMHQYQCSKTCAIVVLSLRTPTPFTLHTTPFPALFVRLPIAIHGTAPDCTLWTALSF